MISGFQRWIQRIVGKTRGYDRESDEYFLRMRDIRRKGLQSARDAGRAIRAEEDRHTRNPWESTVFPDDNRNRR